jgi:hypothetical protein
MHDDKVTPAAGRAFKFRHVHGGDTMRRLAGEGHLAAALRPLQFLNLLSWRVHAVEHLRMANW